jgi:hypothetical protein
LRCDRECFDSSSCSSVHQLTRRIGFVSFVCVTERCVLFQCSVVLFITALNARTILLSEKLVKTIDGLGYNSRHCGAGEDN